MRDREQGLQKCDIVYDQVHTIETTIVIVELTILLRLRMIVVSWVVLIIGFVTLIPSTTLVPLTAPSGIIVSL